MNDIVDWIIVIVVFLLALSATDIRDYFRERKKKRDTKQDNEKDS